MATRGFERAVGRARGKARQAAVAAPADALRIARPRPLAPPGAPGAQACACGGSCPRCVGRAAPSAMGILANAGQPMARALRERFEPRFRADFSGVRLHRGADAAASAEALSARAYTVGPDIVFGAGAYAPETPAGARLLAHELAHTVQQRNARATPDPAVGAAGDAYERQADAAAAAATSGGDMPAVTPSALAVQRVQRTTDAEVESGTGVDSAISSGTMTAVTGVHGSTFDAVNCFGVEDCKVHFTFEKAYKGLYPYRAAGGTNVRGLYVKIVARPDDNCWSCNHLEIVQVLRYETMKSGAMVTAEPTSDMRRARAGWSDARAPSRGWEVDAADTERNPFYSQSWVGQSGDFRTPAILWDTPGSFETDRNIGKDFQTCLLCVNGSSRIALGCVTWGYYIDSAGAIAFQPQPAATCGATTQLRDASNRWDTLPDHQHIDLGSDRPGRPAGETPRPVPPGGSAIG